MCSLLITCKFSRQGYFACATPEHRGQFSNASCRGSSSSSNSYQPRPTCGRCCCGWTGIAATIAVVSQTTRHESAGCGVRVMPQHNDELTVCWQPTNSTLCDVLLLLQGSRCRPSKQYRPNSTVFLYVRALVVQ